ncbi:LPXTG cell wall anchor domain-containing protein, partial [Pseudoflavonifractor sp. An187]|uniref:LPXTG cell wall anchor domain-containing protein n=1 Tax=Pseudoflavonifractor sp. An187 TaxID=1965578 RepID=UPI000B55F0F2
AVAALSDAMNGLTAGGAPEATQKPENNVPQTGDNAQLGLVFGVLVLSAAGLAAVVTMRRRRS